MSRAANKYLSPETKAAFRDRHEARSCKIKVRYATEAQAREDFIGQGIYRCRLCGGYHRTSRKT